MGLVHCCRSRSSPGKWASNSGGLRCPPRCPTWRNRNDDGGVQADPLRLGRQAKHWLAALARKRTRPRRRGPCIRSALDSVQSRLQSCPNERHRCPRTGPTPAALGRSARVDGITGTVAWRRTRTWWSVHPDAIAGDRPTQGAGRVRPCRPCRAGSNGPAIDSTDSLSTRGTLTSLSGKGHTSD